MSTDTLTYEKVWEMFQETDRKFKETERIVKKLSKNIGGLNNSLGGLIETLMAARLWEKFGVNNLSRAYRRVPIYNENNKEISDIDILLSNTEWVMAIEVKREVGKYDIDRHIKRMQWIRDYPPAETKGKKLLGAVAGGEIELDMVDLAHQSGFFVLVLKGESTELISPDDFMPKIW